MKTALFSRKQYGGVFSIEDQSLSTGDRFFVHSGTGTDAAGYGVSPDKPLATIDYAIGLCADNKGDIIYVMPGHNEALTAALTITMDKIGVSIIGLGNGADRPRLDYDNAAGLVTITAASCKIKGIQFLPSVTAITKAINIAAADVTIEDCVFLPGEDGAGVDEFTTAILIATLSYRATIRGNSFYTQAGDASAIGVKLVDVSDGVVIRGNVFEGAYSTAAINGITGASTHVTIVDNDGADVKLYALTTGIVARNGTPVPDFVSRLLGAKVGNIYYVDGGSTGPVDNYGNGTSPDTPKQTITAALAKCVSGHDDYIFVMNYGSNGRAAETWPIAVTIDSVHIIGVMSHGASKWAAVTATGTNKDAFSVTGARCEIANLEIGGTAAGSGCGIAVGNLAGVWGLYVHDCWFGVADGAGTNGIKVGATFDAPYLVVENCKFGNGLLGAAILLTGVATKGWIRNNEFIDCLAAIDVDGSCVGLKIRNNVFVMDGDTSGDAVSLPAGSSDCFADGNVATIVGKGDPSDNVPFVDASSANAWGLNYRGKTAEQPS